MQRSREREWRTKKEGEENLMFLVYHSVSALLSVYIAMRKSSSLSSSLTEILDPIWILNDLNLAPKDILALDKLTLI